MSSTPNGLPATPTATVMGILDALGVLMGSSSQADVASQILTSLRMKLSEHQANGVDSTFRFLELCAPELARNETLTATIAQVEGALNETLDVGTSFEVFRELAGFLILAGFDEQLGEHGLNAAEDISQEMLDVCINILGAQIDFVANSMLGARLPELRALRDAQTMAEREQLLHAMTQAFKDSPEILGILAKAHAGENVDDAVSELLKGKDLDAPIIG